MPVIDPPLWSDEELEVGREKAIAAFCTERLEEPLEDYLDAFDEYQGHIEEILETTVDLSRLEDTALDVLGDPNLLEAFRYLAGPPISQDDLKTVSVRARGVISGVGDGVFRGGACPTPECGVAGGHRVHRYGGVCTLQP